MLGPALNEATSPARFPLRDELPEPVLAGVIDDQHPAARCSIQQRPNEAARAQDRRDIVIQICDGSLV